MNENMTISQNGLNFIKRWEGCVLKQYICPAGKPTIGIGHVVLLNESFPSVITEDQALEILRKDVLRFETAIKKYITVILNQNQFDALLSFIFNVGEGGIKNTNVAQLINGGKFDKVPKALEEWSKFKVNGQLKVNQGLLNRRKAEGELFISLTQKDAPVTKELQYVNWTKDNLKIVQALLKSRGLYDSSVDGIMGPRTLSGLIKLSEKEGFYLGIDISKKIPQEALASIMKL